MRTSFLPISLVAIALTAAACGGFVSPKPNFTPPVVQGQYEIVASSNVNPEAVTLVEANFTQSHDRVSAGESGVMVIQGTQPPNSVVILTSLGAKCDNGVGGNDSVQGTFSSATQLPFTWAGTGALGAGTSSADVTVSPDGSQMTSGTYTSPAQCGFAADNGTVTGVAAKPFGGQYAGQISDASGTIHSVVVTLSQKDFTLTVSGTADNTSSIILSGEVIGATFGATGSFAGGPVSWTGRYLAASDTFLIYDSALARIGTLGGGT
jgi:hypothetical protein